MNAPDHRKHLRKKLNSPRVAAILPLTPGPPPLWPPTRFRYVDVVEHSSAGAALRSACPLEVNQQFYLTIYHSREGWKDYIATSRWCSADHHKSDLYGIGASVAPLPQAAKRQFADPPRSGPLPSDYEFFRTVPFLRAIHRDAVCPLLNAITFRFIEAGARFITQGEAGDKSYIVQCGESQVVIEKQGQLHPVARICKGDFLGEMALLTGEPRSAHVVASSDMELWEISKEHFEKMIANDPAVGSFLTEIMSERFSSRSLTADRSIGKYTITDIIGRGGYSIVYRAIHMDLNRPAAIKMLKHDMALNAEFLAKFREEAQMIASFNNENIVKVYDIEECYRTVFIIMELLEGRTLNDLIEEKGCVSLKDTIAILLDVCKGLQYAHHRGIVHQDIKPGNIFISSEGTAKVLDFGLAAPCGSEHFMVGTPFYMSPEQVECLPVDARSDIYSLGLTAFEMVTGHRPFEAADAHLTMRLHAERDIPDPGDLMPGMNGGLRRFITRACARKPDARYPDIAHAMREIESIADQLRIMNNGIGFGRQKMKTLFLFYREHQEPKLNRLVEEFSTRLKSLDMDLKAPNVREP